MRSRSVLAVLAVLAACGKVESFDDASVDAPLVDDAPGVDAPDVDAPALDAANTETLVVTLAGSGAGTVSSNPAGIDCGSDCQESYTMGTVVTLTASPASSSTFTGWSGGGCSGTGTCTVTLNQLTAVTATFDLRSYTLMVTPTGTGTGTVTSSPAGISCGSDCAETYTHGSVITLTATTTGGNSFTGWSGGGCSGTGSCVVTLTAATTVSAGFAPPVTHTLMVTRAGSGTGSVSSSPGGISCPTDCSEAYMVNTVVTLTATAATSPLSQSSFFAGWSGGGCSGVGACTVTMSAAVNVTATFTLHPNIAFVTSSVHTGNLGGLAGADAICNTRAASAGLAGTYRAWLSSSAVSAASRLQGASGWVRRDGEPLASTPADVANGRLFTPLRINELGADVGQTGAHTATTVGGTRHPSSTTCNDYTTALAADTLIGGFTDSQGGMWTVFSFSTCAATSRLYCFGVDRAAAVAPVPPAGGYRRAFTTNASFVPGGGFAAADTLCQNEASAAGLPGTYRAVLASTTASAASRFNTAAGTLPWGRPDGQLIASTAAEAFTAPLLRSAPNTTADLATHHGNSANWMGASSLTVAGNVDLTCGNWTLTGNGGSGGRAGATTQTTRYTGDINGCAATFVKLTCFQQ